MKKFLSGLAALAMTLAIIPPIPTALGCTQLNNSGGNDSAQDCFIQITTSRKLTVRNRADISLVNINTVDSSLILTVDDDMDDTAVSTGAPEIDSYSSVEANNTTIAMDPSAAVPPPTVSQTNSDDDTTQTAVVLHSDTQEDHVKQKVTDTETNINTVSNAINAHVGDDVTGSTFKVSGGALIKSVFKRVFNTLTYVLGTP